MSEATLIRTTIYYALLLLTICVALRKGGPDEVLIAKMAFVASIATWILRRSVSHDWHHLDWTTAVIDLAFLLLTLRVAIRSVRYWPLYTTALTLVMCSGHFMKVLGSSLSPLGYFTTSIFWSYPIVLTVLLGALRSEERSQLSEV